MPAHEVAVFVCSSDSRRDVLERVLPSLLKFWPDCPYPIYVGLNSKGGDWPRVISVLAPVSEWYRESTLQLTAVTADYVILILDDFLISAAVDQDRIGRLVTTAMDLELPYFRLVPLGRSLPARLAGRRAEELLPGIELIHPTRPFHAALQIAIWSKPHLLAMLNKRLSIWEFEHEGISGSQHCAIGESAAIRYRHVVEKGRWLPDARELFRRSGLPTDLGERRIWSRWRHIRLLGDRIRWLLLGYANY